MEVRNDHDRATVPETNVVLESAVAMNITIQSAFVHQFCEEARVCGSHTVRELVIRVDDAASVVTVEALRAWLHLTQARLEGHPHA